MFNKLTSFKLTNFQDGWKLFPKLLERAPCLELLVIHEDFSPSDYIEEFPEMSKLVPTNIPLCFPRSLKEVKLCMFKREEFKDDWLGHLLKNGKALQKVTVTVPKTKEDHFLSYLERRFEIKRKLLALPKASDTCQIVVGEKCFV